jgi:SAM-dependent methyltransferase
MKSGYLFEREQRADTVGVRLARENDFPGYLRARMAMPGDRSCRNFQINRLAMAEPANGDTELARALHAFGRLPFIGSVEAFEPSLAALERLVKRWFPEFRVFQARENVSRPPSSLDERLAALKRELGEEVFDLVTAANADDFALYQQVLARYLPQTGDGEGLRVPTTAQPMTTGAVEHRTWDGGTAEQIIETLPLSPDAYPAAARGENEVEGRAFSNVDEKAVWDEDRVAAMRLRPERGLSLARVFRERGLTFRSGLSVACGSGAAEREFLRLGICDRFHGIDMSPEAIAEARESGRGLDLTYAAADLNRVALEPGAYDLAITQNGLRNVLELEHLAEQIWRSLKPGGYLWIHDYIGESQFQFSDLRLDIANRILAVLPERYRRDRLRDRVLSRIVRPNPEALSSPFEAVRSAEIVPIFSRWFDIDYRHEESVFMGRVCPRGMRANYTETEDGPALFELMMLIESLLVEHRILAPHTGQYLMRRKADFLHTEDGAESTTRTEEACRAAAAATR